MSEVTLYAKDGKGNIRVWTGRVTDSGLEYEWGSLGGSMQTQTEEVEAKSTRTWDEQCMLQLSSKVAKKRDAGYCYKLEDAQNNARTNALNLARPMLAQTYDHPRQVKEGALWQYKYNGLRCLMVKTAQGIVAYSRNGKPFTTLGHITSGLELIMEEGDTLDGELYSHGKTLQSILSFIKRKQPGTADIKYHIYDKISDEPFWKRYKGLQEAIGGDESRPFRVVPTLPLAAPVGSLATAIKATLGEARALGYEGIMIRHSTAGYESGKRSKSLLKVKVWLDEEYEIIAVHDSKDGWAILECKLPNGRSFTVSAPGSIAEKRNVLRYRANYLGKWVSVQFAEFTKDGIPFHPVATMFRDKDAE